MNAHDDGAAYEDYFISIGSYQVTSYYGKVHTYRFVSQHLQQYEYETTERPYILYLGTSMVGIFFHFPTE